MIHDLVVVLILPVLVLNTIGGLSVMWAFQRRVRQEHPDTWDRLGRPTLIRNNSVQNGLRTQRFIWKREDRKLDDRKLSRMTKLLRWSLVLQVAAMVAFVVVFM